MVNAILGVPFSEVGKLLNPKDGGCGAPTAPPFLCLCLLYATRFSPTPGPLTISPRGCNASHRMNFCLQKETFKFNFKPLHCGGESL